METARDIYAGVLFKSNVSGNIKGIDIKLPGKWEQNSYDDWHYIDKYHLFELFIYENLNTSGSTQNLLFSKSISYTGQGWYHVNIDLDSGNVFISGNNIDIEKIYESIEKIGFKIIK